MQKTIEALAAAYIADLNKETAALTAILKFVTAASAERRWLLEELEANFQAASAGKAMSEPSETKSDDPIQDLEQVSNRLLRDLGANLERARTTKAELAGATRN